MIWKAKMSRTKGNFKMKCLLLNKRKQEMSKEIEKKEMENFNHMINNLDLIDIQGVLTLTPVQHRHAFQKMGIFHKIDYMLDIWSKD